MPKKFIFLFIVFLVSFSFAKNSFAIILENLPTYSDSVQPIPIGIISNMTQDFNISNYNFSYDNQNYSDSNPTDETFVPNSDSKINTNQNNKNSKTMNHNFLYWLITPILITVSIFFLFVRKLK